MSKRRRKKLSADPITASIVRLSHEGRGIAEINGKTTFVFGALLNETIRFRYTKCRRQFDEGDTVEIMTPSKERVAPICSHFGTCGGCRLQHMHPQFQIQHKQSAVLSLLKNTPPKETLPPITAKTTGYRRKARIGVKFVPRKEKVLVGFREKNAPYVTDMNVCHTLHPEIGKSIDALSQLFMTLDNKSHIPQLEIAVGDDAVAIILRHLMPLPDNDLKKLIAFFNARQWHLYLQPDSPDSIHRITPITGEDRLHYDLPDYGLTLQFHPAQFTQINHEINQYMIARAIELLDLQKDDSVLDLFCGIGNFSLPMAQYAKHVVGVEGDASAVLQANINAKRNKLNNTKFYTANLFDSDSFSEQTWAKGSFDKILLDPPRTGAKEILNNIAQWKPSRLVYVSCNPATLARDAEILNQIPRGKPRDIRCAKGYYLAKAGIIDMFPHTQHVEVITLFTYE